MVDKKRIEEAVKEILLAIGEDLDREGLKDTPKRVAKAYEEMLSGMYEQSNEHLHKTFSSSDLNQLILKDI